MMSILIDYLNTLDQDANARDTHEQNPLKAMRDFGLSVEEQQAMLSGDKKQVAQLMGIGPDEWPVIEVSQFVEISSLDGGSVNSGLLVAVQENSTTRASISA